jgi:hypothetical protein
MPLSRDELLGRRLVIGIIAICMAIFVVVIVYNIRIGPRKLTSQIIRLLLEIALFTCLYRRKDWARWLSAILFGAGGVMGLYWATFLPSGSTVSFGSTTLMVGLALFHLGIAFLLLAAWPIRSYCDPSEAQPD